MKIVRYLVLLKGWRRKKYFHGQVLRILSKINSGYVFQGNLGNTKIFLSDLDSAPRAIAYSLRLK